MCPKGKKNTSTPSENQVNDTTDNSIYIGQAEIQGLISDIAKAKYELLLEKHERLAENHSQLKDRTSRLETKMDSLTEKHEKVLSANMTLRTDNTKLSGLVEVLTVKVDALTEKHDNLYKNYDHVSSQLFDTKQALDNYNKQNKDLVEKNDTLTQQLETTISNADDVEMSQRIACLVVSNLPKPTGKTEEDTFIEFCNDKLRLSENISKDDIANITRIRSNDRNTGGSNRPNPMVIRFQNEKARNSVFANKKYLKGTGKVISEFLTPKRNAILKECYDRIPGTFSQRSIWTHHGKILVKQVGNTTKIREIKSSNDINKFLSDHGLTERSRDQPQASE